MDRERDTLAVAGWKLDNFRKNPVVLFAHRSDQPPVGKVVSVLASAGQLRARVKFASDLYEFAGVVERLVSGGYLTATSVGFQPTKWLYNEERGGFDFAEQELLELSIVPVPCNPDALLQAKERAADVAVLADWNLKSLEALRGPGEWVATAAAPSAAPPPEDPKTKAGRVLSRANETALRNARAGAAAACQHLDAVLAACDEMEPDDDAKAAPTTTAETAAPAYVVRFAPPAAPVPAVDLASVDAAITRGVGIAVQRAISRALGRLED